MRRTGRREQTKARHAGRAEFDSRPFFIFKTFLRGPLPFSQLQPNSFPQPTICTLSSINHGQSHSSLVFSAHSRLTLSSSQAGAATKKTAQSNATLLQTLLLAPFLTAVLHLPLRWLLRSRAFFSWPSFIFVALVAGQVFGWRFLKLNAGVRRDARGMMKSAGVDLSSAGGLIEVIQDLYVPSLLIFLLKGRTFAFEPKRVRNRRFLD